MNIQEIISLTENKLNRLNTDIASYQINGDIELYEKAKAEYDETQNTLDKLKTL